MQQIKNLDTQKWIIKKSSEGVFYIVSKWNYIKLIDLAIDGITSFTTSPLRISTYIAIPTFLVL